MELTATLSRRIFPATPAPAIRRVRNQFKAAYNRVFGCWHRDMSRPITRQHKTYRVCMDCGANRAFDTERWEMVGPYFCEVAPQTEAQVQATLNS